MATQLMREALQPLYLESRTAHPGLLIQRGHAIYDQDTDEGRKAKTAHIQRICKVTADEFYHHAYQRWHRFTSDELRFHQIELALESRLFIGLTGGGMLETGCAISHSHGMPYIPGSSIKGVVHAHVSASSFGRHHTNVIDELFGDGADPEGPHPEGLSGLVSFHDAWWVPGSADKPLVEEVVTSHHLEYYGNEGQTPATDLDSPIPNAQIAVQGHFLFVLEGPVAWLDLAEKMLIDALSTHGIGARTRTGYGLFDSEPKVPKGPVSKWVEDNIAELSKANHHASPQETLRGKQLAEAWSKIEDPKQKAEALADIRSRWEAEGWWDSPPGKSAKKAKSIYDSADSGAGGAP